MWNKLKGAVLNSLTIALCWVIGFLGTMLDTVLTLPDIAPNIKQEITDYLGGDPQTAARVSIVLSALFFAARLRSLRKTPE